MNVPNIPVDFQKNMGLLNSRIANMPVNPISLTYSDTQYEIIKNKIIEFQNSLDSEHEAGIMLASFNQATVMRVENIGYAKSVLMIFNGFVDGNRATLIQHVSQLNFLLIALERADKAIPARRIGFQSPVD